MCATSNLSTDDTACLLCSEMGLDICGYKIYVGADGGMTYVEVYYY